MKFWKDLKSHLAGTQRRNHIAEFSRELQSHLDLEAEEQQDRGLPADESRYAARRAFGNTGLVTEDVRSVWSAAWVEGLGRDLRYAARTLRKNPGFAIVAILTLALGIGANTAIFSAVDALLLRPLPFADPSELVRLYVTKNGRAIGDSAFDGPSPLDVRDYAASTHSFQGMVAYDAWRKNVSFAESSAEPEQMRVGLVPAAYFETLKIEPLVGRPFTEEENREGKNFVAAISEHLWRTRFTGDPAILGRKLRINAELYLIVAVMPDVIPEWLESSSSGKIEVWTPFAFDNLWSESSRASRGFSAIARLKAGVSIKQAQADISTVAAALEASHPLDRDIGVLLKPIAETRVGTLRPVLFLLMGAVTLILLIACVNLANLLLVRNSARERELALRTALGSGRAGLVRHLLAETLLLSLIGATLGLGIAQFGLATLARVHPPNLPQLNGLGLDWRVLLFTFLLAIATSLLFGLAPVLTSTQVNLVDALKQGGRSGTSGPFSQRMRRVLVVVEMAMSLMLLVGAGLLTQSILRLDRQNLGVRPDHLLKGHFYMPDVRYPNSDAKAHFCDEFARRVRATPGVVDAAITTYFPPNNGWFQMLGLPGRIPTRPEDVPTAQFGVADSHFLTTMGIPLLRGRDFSDADSPTSTPVALISEEFARRYFVGEDPIGRRIHIGPPAFLQVTPGANISDNADVLVIGVVGDFRNAGLAHRPDPHITVLYSQHPLVNYGFKDILIRTAADPYALAPEIARQLHQLDADMPFAEVQTIQEHVEQETGSARFTTVLLGSFAVVGLLLAIVGNYGVVSFLVAQRRQELAVRMAVGASRSDVLWLVLKQSLSMATIGAVLGLIGAMAAQRFTTGLLFGISPFDPATYATAAALLLFVAAGACAIPGSRVLRIQPALTLRQD